MTTLADHETPLSVRAVDRVADLFNRGGDTRRSFLFRLAVVGSAISVGPLRFLLRPTPAYASVCGSGNTCGSGWSVFCCTINGGANTCPSGSFAAGWWKVDASAFCLGAPRYYIDCNRRPGSSCRCRCNTTGCDRRRVCCNVFRYGQCNTHIGGVTEVVCRIITCTPPWKWDPGCGRTVRTANATRSHSSRCLPGTNPSHIEIKYQDMGLVGSVLGAPDGRERDGAGKGRKRRYERGMILWHPDLGAHYLRRPIFRRYRKMDAESGPLGYPRRDQRGVGDSKGVRVRFQRGSIYRRKGNPARAVLRRSDRRYRQLGGPKGKLGYPTTNTRKANGKGKETRFDNGAIFMSGRTDAVEVMHRFLDVFDERGGPAGSRLGFPTERAQRLDDGGRLQRFERGVIAGVASRALFAVRRQINERYQEMGGPGGMWGYPTGHTESVVDAAGMVSPFQHVTVFWSKATGAIWVDGPILDRYLSEGGPTSALGFPVTDVVTQADGTQTSTFEGGSITYDPATGEVRVDYQGGQGNQGGRKPKD